MYPSVIFRDSFSAPPGTRMAFTTPRWLLYLGRSAPFASVSLKNATSVFAAMSEMSVISSPYRVSGRSMPNRSIASR